MKYKNIKQISEQELKIFLKENSVSLFRLNQIQEWLWKKNVSSFNDMTNISKKTRNLLMSNFEINKINIHKKVTSYDGTIKYNLRLFDNKFIEGVLIPSQGRVTACVSSQVGCSLSCNFCATGKLDLSRNLCFSEIYDQTFILNEESKKHFSKKISNIVFMGMGEPLLNYNNLIKSISLITNHKGMSMSPKRITVSTVGIAKMIRKLADDQVKFNLALSLHSASSLKRNLLMPINESIPLTNLKDSIKYFYKKTQARITYEYVLLNDINDGIDDAKLLADFCKISPCKINLIEYNSTNSIKYKKSSNEKTLEFIDYLKRKNLIVHLRRSRGKDIAAACGQLVNEVL